MKVYLVMDYGFDEGDYEDRYCQTDVIAVCSTEEKAKQIIKSFVPHVLEEEEYVDDNGDVAVETVTITEEKPMSKYVRIINETRGWNEWTHNLYIIEKELEV